MNDNEWEDSTEYQVVLNDEEQYSIWPVYRTIPAGWRPAPMRGAKSECLAYIDRVWTDMRPLSLRKQTEAWQADQVQTQSSKDKCANPGSAVDRSEGVSDA
jgi:MbtH protein